MTVKTAKQRSTTHSVEEMRRSVKQALRHASTLRDLDGLIKICIKQVERLLWDLNVDSYTSSGDYSYTCSKGH